MTKDWSGLLNSFIIFFKDWDRVKKIYFTYINRQQFPLYVHTLEKLPPEELNPHDREYEPEHQAHQQHVEDTGDSVHEGVHHYSHALPAGYGAQWPQGS